MEEDEEEQKPTRLLIERARDGGRRKKMAWDSTNACMNDSIVV